MTITTLPLPQLTGTPLVTDGGMETDLIFHHGVDLPAFAAFPLLDDEDGRALLTGYYDEYAAIARRAGRGLSLEAPTWRANPDWGARVGYDRASLVRVNMAAIAFLDSLRERYAQSLPQVVVSGMVGPRGDGYRWQQVDAGQAAAYHRDQITAFAQAGADLVTAYTMTGVAEAMGIVIAAREAGIPVAVGFTVETDGRLPDGTGVAQAIDAVDAAGGPDYFLLNCAHPSHMTRALGESGSWRERIVGVRANASTLSHAELDEATELDDGDPDALAGAVAGLRRALPNLVIVGGCCGTDARHVARMWGLSPENRV